MLLTKWSSPLLQVEVHGRVQVNVCYIQELCVKDAGPAGRSHAEGGGGTGWRQVQPLHCFPRRLAEGHADHPLHLGGRLGTDRRQRGVHQISAGQNFVLLRVVRMAVVVEVVVVVGAAVRFAISVPFVFVAPILSRHLNLSPAADGTAQQSLQVALYNVIG